MTDESEHRSGSGEIRQEEDRVPTRALLWTTAAATGIALGAIAAAAIWVGASAPGDERVERRASDAGPGLFRRTRPDGGGTDAPPSRPDGFAWVDREEGVVRIPLEEAMEFYLQEHRR